MAGCEPALLPWQFAFAEEDLLANQRLAKSGEAVNQALANSLKRVRDNEVTGMKDVLDMLSGDLCELLDLARHEHFPDVAAQSVPNTPPEKRAEPWNQAANAAL